jgi:hypothetical protein
MARVAHVARGVGLAVSVTQVFRVLGDCALLMQCVQTAENYHTKHCCTLLFTLPLALQLEKAATAGVVVVAGLIALLAADAFEEGFPAIQDGQLPLWSLKVDSHLPEAFAVVGYAFYMQVSLW